MLIATIFVNPIFVRIFFKYYFLIEKLFLFRIYLIILILSTIKVNSWNHTLIRFIEEGREGTMIYLWEEEHPLNHAKSSAIRLHYVHNVELRRNI